MSISLSEPSPKTRLYPSKAEKDLYEINDIRFSGNSFFSEEKLMTVIQSKKSERSIPHLTFQYFLDQAKKNRATPPEIRKALQNTVKTMWSEIKYYNRLTAEEDVIKLKFFYYQHGYHFADILYSFEADPNLGGNVLKFIINENDRWKVKCINYIGLSQLPDEINSEIEKLKQYKPDTYFDEFKLAAEIQDIQKLLGNKGYYFADFEVPEVVVDTLMAIDSINIRFKTGCRYRVGDISFVDSTKSQKIVSYNMKNAQIELLKDHWFSKNELDATYNNLLSLGTFDMVSIDTAFGNRNLNDSILPLSVFLQYRKQQEYGFAFFTNQTVYNNAFNAGIEFSYFHRNIFGAAQVINPFVRLVAEDLNRSLQTASKLELEYQIGLNFSQALAWTVNRAKIGFSTQIMASQRTLYNQLKIFALSIPVKFPVTLPKWTYFNHLAIDFSFERQVPDHFDDVKKQMEINAKTDEDKLRVQEAIAVYSNLNRFVLNEKPILTANLLGFSLVGDNRDNPFSPTKGKYSFLSIDGIDPIFLPVKATSGIAKYAKLQLSNFWFWTVNPRLVFALKQREGFIYWFDRANSYVPYERQFFAGGANSVRGWASRQLRYNKYKSILQDNKAAYEFARDFTGNAGLIEGSMEFRYSFGQPTYVKGFIADIISSLGITSFLDWGNAYQWMIVGSDGSYPYTYKWYEIFQGIACSWGFGLRYNTPVGPFRIDLAWPVYDPNKEFMPFSNMQFNIGLGHAF